jgi:CheY-like chemotaxis protein
VASAVLDAGDSGAPGRQTSAPGAGAAAPLHLFARRRGSSCRSESAGSAAGGFLSLSVSSNSISTPTARDPGPFAGLGLRGLVVDDTASNLKLLVRLLCQLGVAEVVTAEHGEAALAVMRLRRAQHDAAALSGASEGAPRPGAAAAAAATPGVTDACEPLPAAAAARAASASLYAIDFILLDRRMPVMDGEECARALRGADFGYAGPIIAVSADADLAFLRAGADDICQKPVSRTLLVSLLRKHLGSTPALLSAR